MGWCPRWVEKNEHTDTTDAEEWDEWSKTRWPLMPAVLRGFLFVLGCRVPYEDL